MAPWGRMGNLVLPGQVCRALPGEAGQCQEACCGADEFGLYSVGHGESGKGIGGNVT